MDSNPLPFNYTKRQLTIKLHNILSLKSTVICIYTIVVNKIMYAYTYIPIKKWKIHCGQGHSMP
jgi:hypothetical protein